VVLPAENPYHIHALIGHTDAIRSLDTYGRYCVSGSYDATVRVWDIVKGKCLHILRGHENKGEL
jgi:F-box and WD-40 domain protein CDC4